MNADKIITELGKFQTQLFVREGGVVIPAAPHVLADNLLRIRGLLIALVDHVAAADMDYRKSKAMKFDKMIKDGIKRSPAESALDMDEELIEKKINAERLRSYSKYVDGLCTSIQSVLKVQSSSDKNQY